MKQNLKILICPLEWGLGHAGRSVALAKRLLSTGHTIIAGAGREHLAFIRKELPGVEYIDFPGYKPGYSKVLPQYLKLLIDLPVLILHVIREHKILKRIIRDNDIDIVISDNRFGLWNKKIRSVYITHMPRIPFPAPFSFLEFTGVILHRMIIRRYSLCFIPDLPGEINLSGKLSHGLRLPGNVRYIGLLSRFTKDDAGQDKTNPDIRHNTVILSGPEPQRGILRKKLYDIFRDAEPVTVFLGGEPGGSLNAVREGNIIWYDHPDTAEMTRLIMTGETIITRAGYTTIMELTSLGCSALLIPTPGQTEQEYLAAALAEKGWFSTLQQKKLKERIAPIPTKAEWCGQFIMESRSLLDKALEELLIQEQKEPRTY